MLIMTMNNVMETFEMFSFLTSAAAAAWRRRTSAKAMLPIVDNLTYTRTEWRQQLTKAQNQHFIFEWFYSLYMKYIFFIILQVNEFNNS